MIEWIRSFFVPQLSDDQSPGIAHEELRVTSSRPGRIDTYSDTWAFISKWLEVDLAKSREANDSSTRDAAQTAMLRGRIKLLKELIELPLPPKRDRRTKPEAEEDY